MPTPLRLGVALLAVASLSLAPAPPVVSLRLSSAFAAAPATVRVIVSLAEPSAEDRALVLTYDGEQAGSSIRECPCPRQLVLDNVLVNLPAGQYVVRAVLLRSNDEVTYSPLVTLVVTGRGIDPQ